MGQELGNELARYVIEAVTRQGRSCREVAAGACQTFCVST